MRSVVRLPSATRFAARLVGFRPMQECGCAKLFGGTTFCWKLWVGQRCQTSQVPLVEHDGILEFHSGRVCHAPVVAAC
eukprot:12913808-Prorocentrum_lima.AAC.1